MLRVTVNTGTMYDKLDSLPASVKRALLSEAKAIAAFILADVRDRFGEVFKVINGEYLGSIQSQVKDNPKSVSGEVFTKKPYAGVDEWGGHLPAHDIAPKSAKALYFMASSGEVFAGLVHNPGANIKPHPLWGDVFRENRTDILARLIAAGSVAASSSVDQSEAAND